MKNTVDLSIVMCGLSIHCGCLGNLHCSTVPRTRHAETELAHCGASTKLELLSCRERAWNHWENMGFTYICIYYNYYSIIILYYILLCYIILCYIICVFGATHILQKRMWFVA